MILCTSAVRKKKRPMKDSLIKCLNWDQRCWQTLNRGGYIGM
jgi:hypothetical protein